MNLLIRLFVNTLAVFVASQIIPGVSSLTLTSAFIVAIVLGVINSFVRPIILFLTLPVNVLTLGLFTFVINVFMIYLAAYLVPGFDVNGFIPALLFSIVVSVIVSFLSFLAL